MFYEYLTSTRPVEPVEPVETVEEGHSIQEQHRCSFMNGQPPCCFKHHFPP